jgi:hypothetical protein
VAEIVSALQGDLSQTFVACDLILYLLLLKEKEDDFEPGCP